MGISPSTFRAVEKLWTIKSLASSIAVVTPSGLPRAKLLRCPLAEVCRCDLRLCWANGHRGSCFQHHQEPWQLRDVRASEAVSFLRVETTFFHPTPMVDQRFPPWNGHNLKVSHPFFGTHITIITRLTTTISAPQKFGDFGAITVRLLQGAKASISTRLHRPDVREYAPTCVGSCSEHKKIDMAA